jgi:vacuolar-type H+-ATPase catalytic subunit A/Vma1
MSGMQSKRLMSISRVTDNDLVDEIIRLRKDLEQVIFERDNALNMCVELARQKRQLNDEVWALTDREKRENP